jgi:hypothetical protein
LLPKQLLVIIIQHRTEPLDAFADHFLVRPLVWDGRNPERERLLQEGSFARSSVSFIRPQQSVNRVDSEHFQVHQHLEAPFLPRAQLGANNPVDLFAQKCKREIRWVFHVFLAS